MSKDPASARIFTQLLILVSDRSKKFNASLVGGFTPLHNMFGTSQEI